MIHALLLFILTAAVVGVIVYIINTYLPIPQVIKTVIAVIAALVLLILGFQVFGVHL